MTVSDDELMELLQVIETMVLLVDLSCAKATTREWMQAHPGEARIIHELGKNRELFSEMGERESHNMTYVLRYSYEEQLMDHFDESRTRLYTVFHEFELDNLISDMDYQGWLMPLRAECVYHLLRKSEERGIGHAIFMLRSGKKLRGWAGRTGLKLATEIQKVTIWTREQHLARQAMVRALRGDFGAAIQSLSTLRSHLEENATDDLYIYTGLPYVPGPGEEL